MIMSLAIMPTDDLPRIAVPRATRVVDVDRVIVRFGDTEWRLALIRGAEIKYGNRHQ